jgi:hypothetical protein
MSVIAGMTERAGLFPDYAVWRLARAGVMTLMTLAAAAVIAIMIAPA